MVSQAQGFVHLLAAAADGSHEPQVFRMRWDQPLKRFARAYAVFRELGPHAEVGLRMSTRNHGELDPNSPPGGYGLTDGDQVLFTPGDAKPEAEGTCEGNPKAAAGGVAASSRAGAPAVGDADAPSVPSPEAADQVVASAKKAAVVREEGAPGSSPWEASVGFPAAAAAAPARASTKGRGRGRGRGSSGGGRGRSRGGALTAEMPAESALVASAASGAKPKARAKGKAKAKAKGKAKAKAKAGSKPLLAKGKAKAQEQRKARDLAASGVVVAVDKQAAPMAKSVAPHVPRNLMRSITATSGPAKGWKVTAWLQAPNMWKQDITGHKVRAHDSMVRWQILAPCRTRKFGTFRSVQDEEGDGVYAQLYTAVRPELLRRISSRRQLLEGITRGPSALGSGQGITPPKRRKCSPPVEKERAVTPRRSVARPLRAALRSAPTELLATQLFTGGPQKAAAAPQMAPWSCDCEAHLRRHSRCAFGGNLQPSVVHLRDYMLIGRGETCDVVLNSRRTPQMISRCHAVLHKEEGAFALVDQGSLNGILINGDPVTGRRALAQGDVVTFGVPSAQPEFDYVFEERPHDGGADAGCKGVLGWEELAMAPTAAC